MAIDLNAFSKDLTYRATASVPDLLADLQTIAVFGQVAAAKQKRFTLWLTLSIVLSAVGFILVVQTHQIALTICVVTVGVIMSVLMKRQADHYRRLTIVPDRYHLTEHVLELVNRDLAPESLVQLRLILSPLIDRAKKIESGAHPDRPGWTMDRFVDRWLFLEGTFGDRTTFDLAVTEQGLTQRGWKRGRSGKSKYKTKTKSKGYELELRLTYPHKTYGAISVLQADAQNAVKLPDGVRLKRLKISDRHLRLTAKTPAFKAGVATEPLYQTILLMFLSLYHILNLARELSQSNRSQSPT